MAQRLQRERCPQMLWQRPAGLSEAALTRRGLCERRIRLAFGDSNSHVHGAGCRNQSRQREQAVGLSVP